MANELRDPLPVLVQANDDESGLSYAMRALHANGLSLERAMHWLGIKSWCALNRQELILLAWHLSVSPDWLIWRSLIPRTNGTFKTFSLLGCKFVGASLRHSKNTAICPECVRSRGFCRASWLLRCIVVCSEHGLPLVDRCLRCQQQIKWFRPSIDVCNCGRYLVRSHEQDQVTDEQTSWARWIEWRIGVYNGPAGNRFVTHIPQILNEMSLDGAMRLVMSFGLLEDSLKAVRVNTWAALSNESVARVISRGLARLHRLDSSLDLLGDVGSLVHMPILERMRSDGVDSTDITNASVLVSALKNNSYGNWDRRAKLPHGQLSLFG